MSESIVAKKAYVFAVKAVKMHLAICRSDSNVRSISHQFLRAATSIGANIEEAIGGHTERDFCAKMSIAYKEARETRYWLRLFNDTGIINKNDFVFFLQDINDIIRISGSIIRTIKNKQINNT